MALRYQDRPSAWTAGLEERASTAVTTQGLAVFDLAKAPADAPAGVVPAEALRQLRPQAGKLARGVVTDAAKESLDRLAAYCNDCLVLVQYMKGQSGSAWLLGSNDRRDRL
jgi:hypothetical protein